MTCARSAARSWSNAASRLAAPWSSSGWVKPTTWSQSTVCSCPRRRKPPPLRTATRVTNQSRVRLWSIATSTTVTAEESSTSATLRSSSSVMTSVSPARRSNRRRLIRPRTITLSASTDVTCPMGTNSRRRGCTSTTRPSTRGGCAPLRSRTTTSRTRPTWSASGSSTVRPASRARKTRVVPPLAMLARLPPSGASSRLPSRVSSPPVTGPDSSLDYHVVDVFTATPYAGNPLAVVLGADDLSTAQMQSLAREFNLSETTFPMAATQDGATYRLRIFTPSAELPFAGHPSVGSAWVMRGLGRIGDGTIVQECGAGLLPLEVTASSIALTGGAPTVGEPLDAAPFLAAVGLADLDLAGTPVRLAGTGLEFAFLHVRDDALARCSPDIARLAELGNGGVSVFSVDEARMHVRVFAGGVGITEDPATGSAALGLGVF